MADEENDVQNEEQTANEETSAAAEQSPEQSPVEEVTPEQTAEQSYESTTDIDQSTTPEYDNTSFPHGFISQNFDYEVGEEEMTPIIYKEPHPFDDLPDAELVSLVEELQLDTKHLELENIVFENFLAKNDPVLISGMSVVLEAATKMQAQGHGSICGISSRRGTDESLHASSRPTESVLRFAPTTTTVTSIGERGPRVNISQKTDLVMRDTEETQTELEIFVKKSHRTKCNLKAELEESGIRLNEYNEAREYFEQSVVIKGYDSLTQRIPAEKFVRYMEEWLKSAELTIEKMRLRTSTLKGQYTKVCNQLTQKVELGETLHGVDFEQLRIENHHFLEKIEQKNHHLFELKKMNGRANLVLTNQKKYLQKCIAEYNKLKNDIKAAESKIDHLDAEGEEVEVEAAHASRKYEQLKELRDNYRVPDVMDYVKKKAELAELKKKLKIWSRRTGIQKIALNTCTRQMKTITGIKIARPSWYSFRSLSDSTSYEYYNPDDYSTKAPTSASNSSVTKT